MEHFTNNADQKVRVPMPDSQTRPFTLLRLLGKKANTNGTFDMALVWQNPDGTEENMPLATAIATTGLTSGVWGTIDLQDISKLPRSDLRKPHIEITVHATGGAMDLYAHFFFV